MRINIKNYKVFIISLSAFFIIFVLNYSDKVLRTVEVFTTNYEVEKIERQGYKSYSVLNGNFQFSLPSSWKTWEQSFTGGEIIYHLNLMSPNKRIHGFIQVWEMEKPLPEFLEESEKSSVEPVDYKFYSKKEVTVNKNNGFLVQYEKPDNKGSSYRAYDCFLQGDNSLIYRTGFYMEGKHWKNYYTVIFNRVIKSIKIK